METLEAIRFGQRHADFSYEDYAIFQRIARLSKKHQRQCENECNGIGIVNGRRYYSGRIDLWAKTKYGDNIRSAYQHGEADATVFYYEAKKIKAKINRLIEGTCFSVEYQHDPRGYTVKLFYNGDFINW